MSAPADYLAPWAFVLVNSDGFVGRPAFLLG